MFILFLGRAANMPEAKLEIRAGTVCFVGEGSEQWLSGESEKLFASLAKLKHTNIESSDSAQVTTAVTSSANETGTPVKVEQTLATFLKHKEANSNQRRKFLATAEWLHDSQGKHRVNTRDVNQALSASNQGRLSNASQNLIENTRAGWIVKEGSSFYVSEEGRAELAAT